MTGARALLAFQGVRNPSDDELLGALMHAEYQGALVSFVTSWGEFCKAWSRVEKAKARARKRSG